MHDMIADSTSMNIPLHRDWGGKRQPYHPWLSREIQDGVGLWILRLLFARKRYIYASRANERGKRVCEQSIQIDNTRQMEQRGCIDPGI
jgi:hypothetical protein